MVILTENEQKTAAGLIEKGLPPKPRYASACNGCGLCCTLQLCPVGIATYGNIPGPCPALLVNDGKSLCAFVVAEIDFQMEPKIQMSLGIGLGCGMQDADTDDAAILEFEEKTRLTLKPYTK